MEHSFATARKARGERRGGQVGRRFVIVTTVDT